MPALVSQCPRRTLMKLALVGSFLALALPLFQAEATSLRTKVTCGTDDDGPSLYSVGLVATGNEREYTAYIVNSTYQEARLVGQVRNVFSSTDSAGNTVLGDAQRRLKMTIYKKRTYKVGHFIFQQGDEQVVSRGFQTCTRNDTILFGIRK